MAPGCRSWPAGVRAAGGPLLSMSVAAVFRQLPGSSPLLLVVAGPSCWPEWLLLLAARHCCAQGCSSWLLAAVASVAGRWGAGTRRKMRREREREETGGEKRDVEGEGEEGEGKEERGGEEAAWRPSLPAKIGVVGKSGGRKEKEEEKREKRRFKGEG